LVSSFLLSCLGIFCPFYTSRYLLNFCHILVSSVSLSHLGIFWPFVTSWYLLTLCHVLLFSDLLLRFGIIWLYFQSDMSLILIVFILFVYVLLVAHAIVPDKLSKKSSEIKHINILSSNIFIQGWIQIIIMTNVYSREVNSY